MIGKSMARGQDQSTPSAGAEAEGRSVGTRSWLILSECHWLTIIGELRSLWFIIILIIALGQNVIFVLHIFLCLNILRQSATWHIRKLKAKRRPKKLKAKNLWKWTGLSSGNKADDETDFKGPSEQLNWWQVRYRPHRLLDQPPTLLSFCLPRTF